MQSQKIETVGKLAGGIAHEFNSIMTAIIGQSEMMLSDLPSGKPALPWRQRDQQGGRAGRRVNAATPGLWAQANLKLEVLDLNKVLIGMENMLRHLMGRDTDVRIVPGIGLKPVRADAGKSSKLSSTSP